MFSAVHVSRMQQGLENHLTNGFSSTSSAVEDHHHGSGHASASPSSSSWRQPIPQTTATTTTYLVGSYSTGPSFVTPSTPVAPVFSHPPPHDDDDGCPLVEGGERRKTPRDDGSEDSATTSLLVTQQEAIALAPTMPHSKRSRSNLYMAPKQIPKNTFTSQVGSLCVNRQLQNPADKNDARQVIGFRRQLSSSKIEAFLSTNVNDHDTDMDVDTEASRPRSMSF